MAGFKSSFGAPSGGKPKVTQVQNKGSVEQRLPSRHALDTLTKGNPAQRSVQMYAKLTPSGASAPGTYADILHAGLGKKDA